MAKKKYLSPILLDLGDGGEGGDIGHGSGEGGDGFSTFSDWLDIYGGIEAYDYDSDGDWDEDDYQFWCDENGFDPIWDN